MDKEETIFVLGGFVVLILICIAGYNNRILSIELMYSLLISFMLIVILFSKVKIKLLKWFDVDKK